MAAYPKKCVVAHVSKHMYVEMMVKLMQMNVSCNVGA